MELLEELMAEERVSVAAEQWEQRYRMRPSMPPHPIRIGVGRTWTVRQFLSLQNHIRARSIVGRFHEITMARRQREAGYRAMGRQIGAKAVAAAVGRQIMDQAIASLRFYRCPCGNEQPFIAGRGKPDCESCGRSAPA